MNKYLFSLITNTILRPHTENRGEKNFFFLLYLEAIKNELTHKNLGRSTPRSFFIPLPVSFYGHQRRSWIISHSFTICRGYKKKRWSFFENQKDLEMLKSGYLIPILYIENVLLITRLFYFSAGNSNCPVYTWKCINWKTIDSINIFRILNCQLHKKYVQQ